MSSDEEYLDDLLKSIVEDEGEPEDLQSGDNLMETESSSMDDLGFAIEDFGTEDLGTGDLGTGDELPTDFAMSDTGEEGENASDFALEGFGEEGENGSDFALEGFGEEGENASDFALEDFGGEEEAAPDFAIEDFGVEEPPADFGMEDMGELLADGGMEEGAADDFAIEDFEVLEPGSGEQEEESLISADDVDAMFAAASEAAAEEEPLIEINSEEDMLALLDSMSNEIEAEQAAAEAEKENAVPEETIEAEEKGKKKKKKRFGKKKGEQEQSEDMPLNEEEAEAPDKKPNIFTKLISFLTEADEDGEEELKEGLEPSDENKSILEELDKEDKKKKKKKGKKGKGAEEGEEEGDGEEKGKKKEKKKKEKKEKKEKAAADTLGAAPERPSKKVSKKSVAVIAGLCVTLMAMIIVFCSIVPMFFDKKGAREAYYQADYKRSYELLYGKKLDESDTIIYNQSKTIVGMNRKLEAYHNYLAIGEEVRALDALMAGVQKYPDIMLDAEQYHVTQEVDAVYETILNILNDKYGLTEEEAKNIIAYDDVTYTRRLESIVNGTPFVDPNEVIRTSPDVLSEEQDFYEASQDEASEGNTESEKAAAEEPASAASETEAEELPAEQQEQTPAVETLGSGGVLGEDAGSDSVYIPEEPAAAEETGQGTAETPSTGGQGTMIQGVRQPIDVQIHGQ